MNGAPENSWHTKSLPELFKILKSGEHGLSKDEVERRLEKHGPNKLPEGKTDTLYVIFLHQFRSPLIYILLVASLIIFAMGEIVDGSIILAILLLNAIVGTVQEGRAQNTLLALKRFVETRTTVLRDGKELIIPDVGLVPGDIIILQEGEKVPADARVISGSNLKINEATLTGESEPKHKTGEILRNEDLSTADQMNMLFKGTNVLSGNGRAIVVATGLETVIGKISREIAVIDAEIPLKASIRRLSRLIIAAVSGISLFLLAIGLATGRSLTEMFTTAVALSVSLIPEGLPIVMTLVLAAGVWRMSKRNALVKNLQAVEALGQASIIAVDKTGTITKNEMVVQKVYVDGKTFEVGGVGYEPKGEIIFDGDAINAVNHPELLEVGKIASFGASSRVMFAEEEKVWRVSGDPTEAAVLVLSEKLGFNKDDMEEESPLVGEMPFDYKLKYRLTIHQLPDEKFMSIIGAPEVIIELAEKVWRGGRSYDLSAKDKKELESVFLAMSEEGLRVIALAERTNAPDLENQEALEKITFVSFCGMKDALRQEVVEATNSAISAGIKVVMITGDHKFTAQVIAKEAGIYREGGLVLTGQDIDRLTDKELARKLPEVSVFARVTPEHKLRIIRGYKALGEIIAMTGDGVNDAPSLVAADLGVAMGKVGTEVAKEGADIVLLDDNFGSIVSAVEEGRSIFKTIKKVILYLFSTSIGEALVIIAAILLSYPLPLLPAQIIWLNFVTDGFLDVSLAMEPKEDGLLREKRIRGPEKNIFNTLMTSRMLLMAITMTAGTLILFAAYLESDAAKAGTIVLTMLAAYQWFNAWNCRHESKSIFQMNPLSNKFLVGATLIVVFLQVFVVYSPLMQKFLHTTPLNIHDWFVVVSFAASIIIVEEIRKLLGRKIKSLRTNPVLSAQGAFD